MAGQHQAKYAATVGTQLLAKIHMLHNKVVRLDQCQDHLIDCLDGHIDFVGEATNCIGKVVDELNNHIDVQDVTGGRGGVTWQAHCGFVQSF